MSHKKSASGNGKSLSKGRTLDEEELAVLLAQPEWNPQQAAQILQAQVDSGQSIAAFATQRGQKAGRLYNWRTRLKQKPVQAEPVGAGQKEAEKSPSVVETGLDLENPGERHAHQYVEHATTGPDRMWSLLGVRRSGPVLLCAVHWVKRWRTPKPYSLVHLDLTEPALWWKDFATSDAARQALEERYESPVAPNGKVVTPALVKVQVRGPEAVLRRELGPQEAWSPPSPCIAVCMPSGIRIQIPDGVPETLISTVLRTVSNQSC